ncbi:hypothetical protein ACS3UN_07160 [Oscillospiraceae bacterium LTW-04]|nr:hypothetical protein RBH76_03185 [Oscillospiraceae bacterium MB24-C1]
MKKVIVVFALVFVAGILAGGAYEWYANRSVENVDRPSTSAKKSKSTASSSESIEKVETAEKTAATSDKPRVTNPNKTCSTPDCDRAVFVTYKGKELCVKCYGEAKNWEAAHE